MASQRDLTIAKLLENASDTLGNLVKWPESEATKKECDLALKALKKFLKEDNYPDVVRYMVMTQIVAGLFNDTVYRDVKFGNYKLAWLKLSEMFD